MILTCPACTARYFVKNDSIERGSGRVRCSACQHVWMAEMDKKKANSSSVAIADELKEPLLEGIKDDDDLEAADLQFVIRTPADIVAAKTETLSNSEVRSYAQAKKKTATALLAGMAWALLCVGFGLSLVGAVLFRVQIVNAFPVTAGAYEAVKLPVNPSGLSFEAVHASQILNDGHVVLIVSGSERNITPDTKLPLPVRVALFDKSGARIREHIGPLEGGGLQPGTTRSFRVIIPDPPINTSEFQVTFDIAHQKSLRHFSRHGLREASTLPETSDHNGNSLSLAQKSTAVDRNLLDTSQIQLRNTINH